MNLSRKENTLLSLIKYGPILFVVIISIVITLLFINHQQNILKKESIKLKNNYIESHKREVKEEVTRLLNTILREKKSAELKLKEQIKNRVYEAHNIAFNIYKKESKIDKNGNVYNKKEVFEIIKNVLSSIKFNEGRGYFFIDDIKGNKVLHPIKSIEGKNLLEFKDTNGYQFVKSIVDAIRNKTESFDSYYWYKGTDKSKSYKKISFYKYFEPYDMAIGTGEYIDDFEDNLKNILLKRISNMRFGKNKNRRLFICTTDGLVLSHVKKKFISTNRIHEKVIHDNSLLINIINFAKKEKNGFITYKAPTKASEISSMKTSYVSFFKDWNWVIGSGFYLEELNKQILINKNALAKSNKNAINTILLISLLFTILFIVISFYISKQISFKFIEYKIDIQRETSKILEKEKILIQQSKMASMGEMIENIAHQWRQPLSVISTTSSGIKFKKEMDVLKEGEIEVAMDGIDNSVQHLSHTIDTFRDFFKTDKIKQSFVLDKTFEKMLKLIISQYKNTDILVIKDIKHITLLGDENELIQVLINILNNARDELIKKEQTIKLILIDTKINDDKVEILITDNAGGIPAAIIGEVFSSHFTTKQDSNGTGIGLYMSKMIIEDHMNGTIDASNTEFKYKNNSYYGATFKICLPIPTEKKEE